MSTYIRRGLFCLFFIFAAPLSLAQAQLFTDDAARQKTRENSADITSIKNVLRDLNEKLDKMRQQNALLTQKNQNLETQLRQINGQLEEIQQQVTRGSDKSTTLLQAENVQLNKKVTELTQQLTDTTANLQRQINEMSQFMILPTEDELYTKASALFRAQDYTGAIEGFMRVLQHYPDGTFSASCRYWLGQAHLAQGNYADARDHVQFLIDSYPLSDKVPDSLLILAQSYRGLEQEETAQLQLQKLLEDYPTSLAADSARQLLAQ